MVRDFGKESFDILIHAGQSNAYGCGIGPVEEPYVPGEDVFTLNGDFSICMAHEEVWGNNAIGNFILPFASRYVKDKRLAEGRKILILRSSVGGTGFLDNRWNMEGDLYLRMMEMIRTALGLNPANRLAGLIWHQGETDAVLGADYDTHRHNLGMLIGAVRTTFGVPELPFVAGDFVYHWRNDNIAACLPVIGAMKDLCGEIGSARFVETDGLLSNDQKIGNADTIHFCRESLYQLGGRYYDAYCGIAGDSRSGQ